MNLDERLAGAATALQQSAARMSDDPGRFRRRLRHRRAVGIAGAVTVLVVAAVPLILSNDDERQVATVGGRSPSTGTAPLAAPTPAPCNQPPSPGGEESSDTSTILVYFQCEYDPPDTVRAVQRRVQRSSAVLRAALEQLVAGPTEEEARRGFSSIFSNAPAGLLGDVALQPNGTAVIDFSQGIKDITNITTLDRMAHTTRSIDATAFQFPQVEAVVLRLDGSEDAWCNLFEIVCQPMPRSVWERKRAQQVTG